MLTQEQIDTARPMIVNARRHIKNVANIIRTKDQTRKEVAAELKRIFSRLDQNSIRIRFNVEEWEVVQRKCRETGKRPGVWLRKLILESKLEPPAVVQVVKGHAQDPALAEISRGMDAIARNMNQLALNSNVHVKHGRMTEETARKYAAMAQGLTTKLDAMRTALEKLAAKEASRDSKNY